MHIASRSVTLSWGGLHLVWRHTIHVIVERQTYARLGDGPPASGGQRFPTFMGLCPFDYGQSLCYLTTTCGGKSVAPLAQKESAGT